jgi:hypothetical protein
MRRVQKTVLLCLVFAVASTVVVDARHNEEQLKQLQQSTQILTDQHCSKCQGPMESGFLLEDRGQYPNEDSVWVQGAPIKRRKNGDVQTDLMRHITAFRCIKCGFIELFANDIRQ